MTKNEFLIQAALTALRHSTCTPEVLGEYVVELTQRMEGAGVRFDKERDEQ